MPAPPISISFAERAAPAFARQARGSTGAPFPHGKLPKEDGRPFPKYSSRISTKPGTSCVERLRRAGAPVRELSGSALAAAKETITSVDQYGLHFAFLDPYNLGELDFSIIETLLQLKRIDLLIHFSVMDLQRNLERNIASVGGVFDRFAPGWRDVVGLDASLSEIRRLVFEYWRGQIAKLGARTAADVQLITGEKNQRLYWLLLATKHQLARKFWAVAANYHTQGELF
jgi:three-Cys-motif partner protein